MCLSVVSCVVLFDEPICVQAGVTLQHLRDAGVSVSLLAVKQRLEGASALQLARDSFNYWEIREAGFSLLSAVQRPGEQQEDAVCALAVLLGSSTCDDSTFRAILEEDLLGGVGVMLRNVTRNKFQDLADLERVRQRAAELVPLLLARGVSCAALLVHAGVLPPLLGMLAQPEGEGDGEDVQSKCLAALALASMSAAAVSLARPPRVREEGTTRMRVGVLQTVLEEEEAEEKGDAEEEEGCFHNVLLSRGVLQLLGQMSRHPALRCRRTAVTALRTMLLSSLCVGTVEEADMLRNNAVHKAQVSFVKAFYAADAEAVEAVLDLLREGDLSAGSKSLGGGNQKCSREDEISGSLSAAVDILYLLVTHATAKKLLSQAGVLSVLLRLLDREIAELPVWSAHVRLQQQQQQQQSGGEWQSSSESPDNCKLREGRHLAVFSALPRVEQLVALLRLVCWYDTPHLLQLVDLGGLELLTLCLREGVLSDSKRADAMWILRDVVAYASPVLMAVGAVEAVLLALHGALGGSGSGSGNNASCTGGGGGGVQMVLEATLSLLDELLMFDNHKYLLRTVSLAANLDVAATSSPSSLSDLGLFALIDGGGGGGGRWLTSRLHEVEAGGSCNAACRAAAASALRSLASNNIT